MGLLALVDGGHQVRIEAGDGYFDLVMHHDRGDDPSPSALHGHDEDPTSTWFAVIADADDDHVIHFESSSPFSNKDAAALNGLQSPGLAPVWLVDAHSPAKSRAEAPKIQPGHPPPGGPMLMIRLRTTVLVV